MKYFHYLKNRFNGLCKYFILNCKEILSFSFYFILFMNRRSSDLVNNETKGGVINILGNGPSSHTTFKENRQPSEKVMAVNFMAMTNEFFDYKPEYYVLIDPDFFTLESVKFQNLNLALSKVDWDMMLFVPMSFKEKAKIKFSNSNICLKFININYLPGKSKLVFSLYKRNLATPIFQNVIAACLYTSINLGFKEIKLHGVESNEFQMFEINERNEVLLNTRHFYGNNVRNITQEGKVGKGEFWKYLRYYTFMLEGYSQIRYYSDFLGCNIVNYTKGSFIDSFDKVK